MTKEEILNGMSEAEFYALYPTKKSWEDAQAKMAYGGSPFIQGFPFGAGITLANGGQPYYGGPIYPAQMGRVVAPTPEQWEAQQQKMLEAKQPITKFPTFNSRSAYEKFKGSNPNFAMYSDADMEGLGANVPPVFKPNKKQKPALAYNPAGQTPEGAGLFTNQQGQQFTFSNGSYNPYVPGVPVVTKKSGGTPCYNCGGSHMQAGGAMTQDLQGQYPSFGYGGYDYGGPSPFNYGQFPAMSHGGDTTEQGANQKYIDQQNDKYTSFIKKNVLKNIQQEEFNKVQDAYMQMENAYMQSGGGFNTINPQNAALQNMYAQNMQQYKDRSRRDFSNFGAMTEDFLTQISAQNGQEVVGNVAMPNWEYSNYVPQNDIRTGYALGKSDYAKLAKLQGKGMVTGARFNYGVLGRVAPRMFGPKSIEVGYINPNKGMFEDLKEPLKFDKAPIRTKKKWYQRDGDIVPTPMDKDKNVAKDAYSNPLEGMEHGELFPKVYAPGKSPADFMSSNLYRQSTPNTTVGPVDRRSNDWEDMMSKKSTAMAPYSEQFNTANPNNQQYKTDPKNGGASSVPFDKSKFYKGRTMQEAMDSGENYIEYFNKAFGGLIKAEKGKQTPISMEEWQNNLRFTPTMVEDDSDVQVPSMQTEPVKEQTEEEALADVAGIQKRRQEQRDMFGPPMGDQPDLFASDTVKFKKKTTGIGRFLGKNAPLIADTMSSMLEAKEYRKSKKKLEESMLADNTFLTSPLNAKDRGDYDLNTGVFRPDQKVPVQFRGYAQWGGFNTMQQGGNFEEGEELDLSPEEIAELKAQGYEIEELE